MFRKLILRPSSPWLILLIACLIKAFLSLGSTPQTCRTNNILARPACLQSLQQLGNWSTQYSCKSLLTRSNAVLHAVH